MTLHEEAKELIHKGYDLANKGYGLANKGYGLAAETVKRRHLVPKSIAVGVFAGLLGVGLRVGTADLLDYRLKIFNFGPWGWFAAGVAGFALGALAVWIIQRFCKEAGGGGITHLQEVVEGDTEMRWKRLIITKALSLFSATAAGMGGGPEAPAIHIGGAAGKGVAATLQVTPGEGEHKALMSAGAAAGLSAAFSAPLSGLVFALEELQGSFDSKLLVAALLASVTADIIGRTLVGPDPVFAQLHNVGAPDLHALPFAIVLGLVAGIVGVIHNRLIVRAVRRGATMKLRTRVLIGGAVGLITGVAALWIPGVAGGGGELIPLSFEKHPTLMILAGLFLARFVSTILFNTTSAAGGLMIPLLAMGGIAGRIMGDVVAMRFPEWVPDPGVLLVIGMGAFFSASIRAPLTGLVLMLELTGNYGFMLPSLVACLVAHLVAEEFGDPPMYHALRANPHAH